MARLWRLGPLPANADGVRGFLEQVLAFYILFAVIAFVELVGGCTVQICPLIIGGEQKGPQSATLKPTTQPASQPADEPTVMDYLEWILHGRD